MAGMWAEQLGWSRLKANLTILQKLKLYDGKMAPGFTEEDL